MTALLNILIFLAFTVFLIVTNLRITLQVKNIRKIEANIFFVIFLLSANSYLLASAMLTWNWFYGIPWQKILQASLGALTFCMVCFIIIASIKSINSKQLRTLLRLPLIGVLVGVYFDYKYILIGCGVIHSLVLINLIKNRKNLLYICRQYTKGYIGIALFLLGTYLKIPVLPIAGFLLFLVMDVQIINAVKLKMSLNNFRDQDESIKS
jgi:hypothetical protein